MTDIFELSDEAVDAFAAANPVLATYAGLAGQDHRWPDLSPEGHQAAADLAADIGRRAEACEVPDARHRLARQVLIDRCDEMVAEHGAGDHELSLNNIVSPHQELRFVFGSQAKSTEDHWRAVVERVASIGQPLDGYRLTLEQGRQGGRTVARRQVEAVIEQGVATLGDGSPFDQLRAELRERPEIDAVLGSDLERAVQEAKDAYRSFNHYLTETYLHDAVAADGVGEERYLRNVSAHLGSEIDAVATYRWGWDEVERLWADMQKACADIDADVTPAVVIDRLQNDPAYAVETTDEFVEMMLARQHHALASLDGTHFDVPEQIKDIGVQIEPAGGASAPHYVGPSEDFSRPGSVWYPIEGQTNLPLFSEITTAYHEGFPGHHLQVGVQTTMGDELSRFHRMLVWYPGSGEGWALYAEHLMGELGFLERPEYVVGLLSSQLMRACRVAIDIGVHLDLPIPDDVTFHPGERWTFDLAHKLATERALLSPADATSEIIRYFGWPGQAISYKVGEQAILDLRAERAAEPGFDLKAFHHEVLAVGSVGLDLLRAEVSSS
jgi:uncharacterized protein (DUF885 family)